MAENVRLRAVALTAVVGLVAAGCADERRSGPGEFGGSVEAPGGAPGTTLLLVAGQGVRDVVGEGGTRSWTAPAPGPEATHELRVLLLDPEPSGALTFRVEVDDVSLGPPSVTVLEAADRDNALRPNPSDVQVRLTLR